MISSSSWVKSILTEIPLPGEGDFPSLFPKILGKSETPDSQT
jgi:hypothetical protein